MVLQQLLRVVVVVLHYHQVFLETVFQSDTVLHSHTLVSMLLPLLVRARVLLLLDQLMLMKTLQVLQPKLLVKQFLLLQAQQVLHLKLLVMMMTTYLVGKTLFLLELVFQKLSSMQQTSKSILVF